MKYETCDVESDYENGEKLAVALKLEFAYLESQETSGQKNAISFLSAGLLKIEWGKFPACPFAGSNKLRVLCHVDLRDSIVYLNEAAIYDVESTLGCTKLAGTPSIKGNIGGAGISKIPLIYQSERKFHYYWDQNVGETAV